MKNVLKDMKIINNTMEKSKIIELMKPPAKLPYKQRPKMKNGIPFDTIQADLLYLPHDNGFKYLLVCVDVCTHFTDAEPLKNREMKTVLKAFDTIFKRKILKFPHNLQVDDGTEFKGKEFLKYFNKNNCLVRYGAPGRTKQQGLVEYYNKIYGRILYMQMNVDELETGEPSTSWVDLLPNLIKSFNKHLTREPKDYKDDKTLLNSLKQKDNFKIGDFVHVALEKPKNIVDGKRLHGNFRETDLKFTVKPHEIIDYYFRPDIPLMYIVEGFDKNAFAKNELKIIKDNNNKPVPRKYTVEKIVNKIKKNNKYFYVVKWKNHNEVSYEPIDRLKQDVPDIVEEFEQNAKKKQK